MNLIQKQDAAIAELMIPRTSEKRAAKYRASVLRQYEEAAIKAGYTALQAAQQRKDVLDMYRLQVLCADEGNDE